MMDYEFRINPGIGMDEIDGFDMANFHIYIYVCMYVYMYMCFITFAMSHGGRSVFI